MTTIGQPEARADVRKSSSSVMPEEVCDRHFLELVHAFPDGLLSLPQCSLW